MPFKYIGTVIASGFGNLMTNIGLVIVFGTIIGTIIENPVQHCAWQTPFLELWRKRSALAMSIIGYVTSIPVFCDSGFVILSPLNKALAKGLDTVGYHGCGSVHWALRNPYPGTSTPGL